MKRRFVNVDDLKKAITTISKSEELKKHINDLIDEKFYHYDEKPPETLITQPRLKANEILPEYFDNTFDEFSKSLRNLLQEYK